MCAFASGTAGLGEANAKGAKNLLVTLGRIWEIPSYQCQLLRSVVRLNIGQCQCCALGPPHHGCELSAQEPLHCPPWWSEDVFSVFILSLILFVCVFSPFQIGDSITCPWSLGQSNIWLTRIIPKNLPFLLTLRLYYQAKLLCEGLSSLKMRYFPRIMFNLSSKSTSLSSDPLGHSNSLPDILRWVLLML